ncbi:MAG: tRNA (cytidine(56)-2'-O)-methyltransferase [Candidatus Marsarchaeota archaeon]|nr:tRNA (cytidine(56)-2'-O)-methyltransferase [Candidatus Marsarchaeota archaeon]
MISILVIGKNSYDRMVDIALTSRAFGASEITFTTKKNPTLIKYISRLNNKWGGNFNINFISNWKSFINTRKTYKVIYLTKYGQSLQNIGNIIRNYKNLLLIVSSEEVNKTILNNSDFNVSITTQPHCEASAIAIFLHHFYEGRELALHFQNAGYKIVPAEREIKIEQIK